MDTKLDSWEKKSLRYSQEVKSTLLVNIRKSGNFHKRFRKTSNQHKTFLAALTWVIQLNKLYTHLMFLLKIFQEEGFRRKRKRERQTRYRKTHIHIYSYWLLGFQWRPNRNSQEDGRIKCKSCLLALKYQQHSWPLPLGGISGHLAAQKLG